MAEAVVRCGVCDSVATEYCKPCLLILCEGCAKGHSFYSGQHDIEPYWEINVPTSPTNLISIEDLSKLNKANDTLEKKNSVRPNVEIKESFVDEEAYVNTRFSSLDMTSTKTQIRESIKMSYVDKGEILKVFEETELPLSGIEPENIKKVTRSFVFDYYYYLANGMRDQYLLI